MAPRGRKAVHLAGDGVDHEEQHDGRGHRQERRDDHLLDRRGRQNVDGAAVFRLHLAGHDAGVLAELATDLDHDRLRGAAHGGHRHAAEQERQQAAEQQATTTYGLERSKATAPRPSKNEPGTRWPRSTSGPSV
jgi:hypothetical protein